MRLVKVKTHKTQRPKRAELIPVSLAWSMPKSIVTPPWTGSYSIAGLPPSSMSPVPIYTPEWRETKWSKAPCLMKQRDRRGANPGASDLEFEVLTARPHTPPLSQDVTSAVLLFQTIWRQPCWWAKPILWDLNSFLMKTLSLVLINLNNRWPPLYPM